MPTISLPRLTALVCAAALLPACTSQTVTDASSIPPDRIDFDVAEENLVDVGIAIFSPGDVDDPERNERDLVDPKVRKAESAYLAYNLRTTLEATENWGAVRVLPRGSQAIDLMVYGEIIDSTGVNLELAVVAVDATGREWLNKRYSDRASQLSYRDEIAGDEDAFQDLYNQIANDLLKAYLELDEKQISDVRTTAMLQFARAISPFAFAEFLGEDRDGNPVIERLPSEDDPMLARVSKIREREQMFIDLIDEHYNDFHAEMSQPYSDWRRYTYEELVAYEDLRKGAMAAKLLGAATIIGGVAISQNSDTTAGTIASRSAILGGITAIKAGFDLSSQAKLHAVALQELAESFEAEIEPLVVEVEGKTVKLEGTAQEQFEEWRRLLREIYQSETGLSLEEGEPVLPDVRLEN